MRRQWPPVPGHADGGCKGLLCQHSIWPPSCSCQKEHPSAGRGRLLVTSREVLLRVQAAEAARVGEANAGLLAETAKLRWENSTLDFLRREITRLRKVGAVGLSSRGFFWVCLGAMKGGCRT